MQRFHLKKFIFQNWILISILILAFVLRWFRLYHESYWIDEIFSINFAYEPSFFQAIIRMLGDVHPPFYYIIAWFWVFLFEIRLLSVVLGVITVFFMYKLGLEHSKSAGLLAAFLLTISYTHVQYSQMARMYSLFMLLFVISLVYRKSIWATVLLSYTHIFGWLIISVRALELWYAQNFKSGFWYGLKHVFWFLPWVPFLIYHTFYGEDFTWLPSPNLSITLEFYVMLGGSTILTTVLLILALRSPQKKWFLYFVPIPLIFLFSFIKPLFYARYFTYLVIPLTLLVAQGLLTFKKPLRFIFIAIIIILSIAPLHMYYTTYTYSSFGLLDFNEGDRVYIHPNYEAITLSFYNPDVEVKGIQYIPEDVFQTPFFYVMNSDYARNETLFDEFNTRFNLTLVREISYIRVYLVE